jgi:NADPH:quinone reductase-like Zn-dependent oxidoreductase
MEHMQMIIERNIIRVDVMIAPFNFIDWLIRENRWDYLYTCSGIVYPRLVGIFMATWRSSMMGRAVSRCRTQSGE